MDILIFLITLAVIICFIIDRKCRAVEARKKEPTPTRSSGAGGLCRRPADGIDVDM
jgi:hypothetical protein